MKILQGNNNKIAKIWVDDLNNVESESLDQIKMMLEIPTLYKHIAVMPDTHLGKGAVVGGVVALTNSVCPNIVGVDIGCGMSAFKTSYLFDKNIMDKEFWNEWKTRVSRAVPMGFNRHDKAQIIGELGYRILHAPELEKLKNDNAASQIGTLGGGNHFLEAQVDQDGYVWFMVHSGSRNTGLKIAGYYNEKAKELNEKYYSRTPKDLWFLPLDDQLGNDYMHDMGWAIDYALENRWRMLEQLVKAFYNYLTGTSLDYSKDVRENGINIHHNFANLENHFGSNVVVHRKGATQARVNQIGIIPGSMGTNSYIIKGKGVEDSFTSCSHGAGRKMSRSKAKEMIQEKDLVDTLKGTFTKPSMKFIDEAPDAYKDIDTVMANQSDLVEITHTLKPIITLKGEGK